jgi:short-subunit dehydrogenase
MGAFDGQVALVTGASSGLGEALARELARRGADVALFARRGDRLDALASALRAGGRRALPITGDVTRDGDLERAVAQTVAELGRLDVLVANAGFGVVGGLETLALDDYRRQFETNVFGVLRTIYAGLAELSRTRGRLVIVGSVSGHVAVPGGSPYAMSKFALRALAEALDGELHGRGVSVTLASPGFVRTEFHEVDNRGVRHPGARHPAPDLVRMPAARAARIIVRAIARRRREVVVTALARITVALHRLLPGVWAWLVRSAGVRARPEPTRRAGAEKAAGPGGSPGYS